MTLSAYLVDDEPLALERLARLLAATGRVRVVGQATEPEEAVAALAAAPPDVCFLDIHMPRLSGFEVLARLPLQPAVVFTTAHAEHALEAFGVNSVDYLLKPVEPALLARALDRVERLRSPGGPGLPDLRALLRELAAPAAPPAYPARIASRLGDRLWFLDLPEVTHFAAEDRLTFAVSGGKRYCVDESIAELERRLDPRAFLRIHRGTLVNVAWIREVSALPGGSLLARLKDGAELTVARDRARAFKERMRGGG
ncbi:MAG: response regulator transcription factor [Deltaproteobacteria bacterium]|nr:response regulator transcription factor [Deltaproteobacteria bacterium]